MTPQAARLKQALAVPRIQRLVSFFRFAITSRSFWFRYWLAISKFSGIACSEFRQHKLQRKSLGQKTASSVKLVVFFVQCSTEQSKNPHHFWFITSWRESSVFFPTCNADHQFRSFWLPSRSHHHRSLWSASWLRVFSFVQRQHKHLILSLGQKVSGSIHPETIWYSSCWLA